MADLLPLAVLFLSPWTALATAVGAVSIPVIIHLLNRKRYRIVPWAAMRFLLNAQRRAVRKLRIEQWVLLALRMSLLLLLLLAMISVLPWLEPLWSRLLPGSVGAGSARSGRTHRIILIDGSFSMGRKHADGTSFDRACRNAQKIVQDAAPGDGFSLFLVSAPVQAIVPGPSDNAANVLQEIEQLRLPHGNGDLAAALTAVERLTAPPLGKYHQREVYLLTDLQRTLFQDTSASTAPAAEDTPAKSAAADAWRRLQARASVIWVDVAGAAADNTAVTHLALGDPLPLTNSLNSVTAQIHNYGSTDRLQLRVDLLMATGKPLPGAENGVAPDAPLTLRLVQQQAVNVPAGASVPVTFPVQFVHAGEFVVQVKIDGDALELDDVRSLVVTVRSRLQVTLVNGKPVAERDEQATHHLATALNPRTKSATGPVSPFEPRLLTEAQFADVALGNLDECNCVFLCAVARLNDSKIERLEAFLRRGGGIIFTLGDDVDFEAYNRLLFRNGAGLMPVRLVGSERAPPEQYWTLTGSDDAFRQPPLAAFADDNDRATLLSARLRQYVKVEVPEKSPVRRLLSFLPSAPGMTKAQSVLDPAVLAWQRHRGRVFLITTTMNLDWGSWPGSPAFLPFVHELARYASLGAPPRVVNANEPLLEYLSAPVAHATVHLPDGRTLTVPVQEQDGVRVLHFPETAGSGIYRLVLDTDREHLFAVNVPVTTLTGRATESDLRRLDTIEFLQGVDGDVQIVTELSQVQTRRALAAGVDETTVAPPSAAGPAVARVVLFIFLLLILIEMVLAWRFGSARTAALPENAPPAVTESMWRRLFAAAHLAYLPLIALVMLALVLLHEAVTGEFLGFLPNTVRSSLERALGVAPAAPGEGTRWRLDYLPSITGNSKSERWLSAALLLAAAAGTILIYRFERVATRIRVPGEPPRSGRSLVGVAALRTALLALTLLVLVPQVRLFFEREGWPDIVLMYDTSRSFGARDDFQDADVEARAQKLAQVYTGLARPQLADIDSRIAELNQARAGISQPDRLATLNQEIAELQAQRAEITELSRLNLAKALTASVEDDWLSTLLQQRQVKVHVYHCAAKTGKIDEVVAADQIAEVLKKVRDLRPTGEASQLGSGIRGVLSDFRGASLGAIIFVTDGVVTDGEDLVQAARAAARADVPLYLVGIGDAHEPRDLILHDLQVEEVVNVRDRLVFDVRVSRKGKLDAATTSVVLAEKKPDGTMVELHRVAATLDPGKPVKVRLQTTPTEPGEKTYVLTVPAHRDEVDKTNNRLERRVHVADARPVRVLYIEGFPHHDYRFIKTLLEREATSKHGNRSIALKVLLTDADKDHAQQDKSALAEFPTRAELNAFDAVIFGDVDPKHPKIGERNLQMLRDFVRERGGGLLLLAGIHEFMPHAYRDSPLADVVPVVPVEDDAPAEKPILEADLRDGYRPSLTAVGQQHPIFRFVTEDAQNAEVWQQLPPLYFAASKYRLKQTAEVLAVHPLLPARRAPTGSTGVADLHPLAVQQFVGAGRVLFFGFNETSRWRYRELELRFNQFWIQTVRYLARSRIGRVEMHLDKQTPYRRNEPIRVTVRFPDDAAAPSAETPIKVLVERSKLRQPGETTSAVLDTQTLQLAKVAGSRATYEALLTRTPEGEYKFWLSAPTPTGSRPEVNNRVLPPPGELDRIRLDQAALDQAAKESRGKFYNLADAGALLEELPAGTRIVLNQPRPPWLLWNHAGMYVLALGLLTAEWILRKRSRLL